MIPASTHPIQLDAAERQQFIIRSFTDHYSDLIALDAGAWRGKFRKMSETPFAFYRGSAALFYADVSQDQDPFLNEKTSRVWIQGDLHAQNFGTYMNSKGVLIFDVNDFDEAYVAPFTWDVKRFCASLALLGYQKALSDAEIKEIVAQGARGYAKQISEFASGASKNFAIKIENSKGALLQVLYNARQLTRVGLLDAETEIIDGDRHFKNNSMISEVDEVTRKKVDAALIEYYNTIPSGKRRSKMTYQIKDVAFRRGLGVGSAGLKIYSILLEGENQALENDLIISMKVARPSAAAPYIKDDNIKNYFVNEGHRTSVSQRALQANADPFLGYTTMDGVSMFVTEISPYTADLNWDHINDVDDILEVVEKLGACIAKIHCCSDDDSDQTLIQYSIEEAINEALDGREADFVDYITTFSLQYAERVKEDHRLFFDAFRNRMIPGL
ncbi:MAG: DUF2252 domain-containing protein [Haliscomenobacter sp.]|uniref:DUF2252 domain-containing protein n=1 Tax=Haliscomenobacter sp. TaxID=2717303 RepID=UPI0029B54A7A|nr:DUF2252 domain-containing protein [Haliscomenobacter sp.]MDX2067638.1 DUF2252 domain-containing protein [Haliscomenobacter sp.]